MHPAVRAIVIPPCPESLLRLQQILAEPELDAAALEQLAASDVALAAAVMRLANSPLYGLAQPVQTVGMALTVLGLRPAVELMSAFITRNALQVRSPLLDHFWESSQRRAIACEHIGHQLYSFDPGLGYSFGLFCHVDGRGAQRPAGAAGPDPARRRGGSARAQGAWAAKHHADRGQPQRRRGHRR